MNVLKIVRLNQKISYSVKSQQLRADDVLVVHGPAANIAGLAGAEGILTPKILDDEEVTKYYEQGKEIRLFGIPNSSRLLGMSVSESCLGDALDVQILAIIRENDIAIFPASDIIFKPGDRLLVSGMWDLVAVLLLQGIEAVFARDQGGIEDISILDNDKVGLVEVILSPHTVLTGQTLQEISFREKFGLSVLAVWRKGNAIRPGLRDLQLHLGDALLLFGSWKKLEVLGREPDFVVLTGNMQETAREEKATTALAIMAAVLLSVIMGWVLIYIAVVIGAASLVAEKVIAILGPFGPYGVLFGLLSITFLATSIIPTAALVVLMVPIALKTSVGLGISPYPLMRG